MVITHRVGLLLFVALALTVVTVKFILPLVAMYLGGVGVTIPITALINALKDYLGGDEPIPRA